MKPAKLDLPTIWRGCTWFPVTLQWLDEEGNPLNLQGWVPRAFTRHFDLNAQVIDAVAGITTIGLTKVETSVLSQGVEDWDWVWFKKGGGPQSLTLPPHIRGKVTVRHPVTNPEALTVGRVGGGCQYVRIDQCHNTIHVIAKLDMFADKIREQLQMMRANGQNQISCGGWFVSGIHFAHPEIERQGVEQEFPQSTHCRFVTPFLNRGWEFTTNAIIPWHAVNPYQFTEDNTVPVPPEHYDILQDATLSPVRTAGRPSHQDNLKTYLSWLNEFGYDEIHVRLGAEGRAVHGTWEPNPPNDNFANAIDLSTPGMLPPPGLDGVKSLTDLTFVYSTREVDGDKQEPPGGFQWTVWYKITADNHFWDFQVSRPNKFQLEAFYSKAADPANHFYWNLHLPAYSINGGGPPQPVKLPLHFQAVDVAHGGHSHYYIRVTPASYAKDFTENYPDNFTLNYGRDIPYPPGIPVPDYPELPTIPAGWQEDQFQENSAYTRNFTALVEANKGDLRVVYDLGGEHANSKLAYNRMHRHFCARMYREWTNQFGFSLTCGFSALGGHGIGYMIDLFKQQNLTLPGSYAVDVYGNEYNVLKQIYNRLKEEVGGERSKKIRIFETYYNDDQVAKELRRVIRETGLNFGGVCHWAIKRGAQKANIEPYFEDGFAYKFNQYINL